MANYGFLFICAFLLEVGWVISVRLVQENKLAFLVLFAMGMQAISYGATLLVVCDPQSMLAGILGAGVGAGVAMNIPLKRDADI